MIRRMADEEAIQWNGKNWNGNMNRRREQNWIS